MARLSYDYTVTPVHLMILVALYVVARPAHAEVIFKSIGPDGDVTYSSQPVKNARQSEAIDVLTLSPEQRRAALLLRQQDKTLSAQVNAEMKSLEDNWRRVDREITSAQAALAQAERALRKGRTPLPGERLGKVGGGSRLTEAYFQRIRNLELSVEHAKQRMDLAYEARNALK